MRVCKKRKNTNGINSFSLKSLKVSNRIESKLCANQFVKLSIPNVITLGDNLSIHNAKKKKKRFHIEPQQFQM